MPLAMRLKEIRNAKKISQRKLASILNISSGAVGMYETGKREPDYETLNRIADFFGVTTDYLLGRTNDPTPPQAKKETHSLEEYVLGVKTLGDGLIRVAELVTTKGIDDVEAMRLSGLVFKKFGVMPAVDTDQAAWNTVDIPGTGALDDDDDDEDD